MAIDVYMENQIHERTERLSGRILETLTGYVLQAPLGSMIRGIHKYADTMFNSYQLKFLLDELAAISPQDEDEREMILALTSAAEKAIRQNGYLWFSGD
ncbi:MAG: hypothetical protein J2P18_05350 [Nocardia sp.]|nr:hypothetical protein [Nocardia sp.]